MRLSDTWSVLCSNPSWLPRPGLPPPPRGDRGHVQQLQARPAHSAHRVLRRREQNLVRWACVWRVTETDCAVCAGVRSTPICATSTPHMPARSTSRRSMCLSVRCVTGPTLRACSHCVDVRCLSPCRERHILARARATARGCVQLPVQAHRVPPASCGGHAVITRLPCQPGATVRMQCGVVGLD